MGRKTGTGALVFVSAMLMCLAALPGCALAQGPDNFTVKLTFDHADSLVYVPVWGEGVKTLPFTSTWHDAGNWFIASYLNNVLHGIVFMGKSPVSIGLASTQAGHHITLTEGFNGSRSAVVFSKGGWERIGDRMGLLEAGTFMEQISPTFGFGLGIHHPIKLILEYPGLDFVGDLSMQLGRHDVLFDYNQTVSGKPQIVVSAQ
jgi:hypothetical protein